MTRNVLVVTAFGVLYTLCAAAVGVLAVGAALSGFEPGTTAASATTVRFLGALATGMMLPLVPLFDPREWWAYPLIFANGVIWASALIAVRSLMRHRGGGRRLRPAA